MADNVELDAGSGGAVVATDDIGGVHYQITKLVIGALDSATLLAGGTGAVTAGTVRVTSAVGSDFEHFSNLDVDTAAEQLTAFTCVWGVQIKADDANTSAVYVGKSDVTAGTTDATDGFKLNPGQGVFLPVSNSNLVYVIGGAANQKVWVIAV